MTPLAVAAEADITPWFPVERTAAEVSLESFG